MPSYRLYGLCLESSLTLPGLQQTLQQSHPDIHIVEDRIAEWPASTVTAAICFRCQGEQVQVTLPGIARLLIRHGNEIIFSPIDSARHDATLLYILNHALAILMLQRGLLVLHAGAFVQKSSAIAIAGPTGQGKSTLLARLWQQGHVVLADEHVAVQLDNDRATVLPGLPMLQLWEPALQALGIMNRHTGAVRNGLRKYWLPIDNAPIVNPTPLVCLQALQWSKDQTQHRLSVSGADKLPLLVEQVYQWTYINGMALQHRVAAQCLQLARMIDVERLLQPRALTQQPVQEYAL